MDPDTNPTKSFCGRYSDVTMWKGELTEEAMTSLANCERIVTRGVVFDWSIGNYDGNEVDVIQLKIPSFASRRRWPTPPSLTTELVTTAWSLFVTN